MVLIASRLFILCAALSAAIVPRPGLSASFLSAYNADISQTSISGISSGAFMAVQFGIAWSSVIKGVGAVAGGPYGCAGGSLATALSTCTGGAPPIDVNALIAQTDAWGRSGAIDGTSGIAAQKIYLFSGTNDQVVERPVSNALHDFYAHYLGPRINNLFYQTAIDAGHAQVTVNYGGPCRSNGGEYINKCGYDQAGIILQHIYGALNPPSGAPLSSQVMPFDQAQSTAPDQPADDSLNDTGFIYVPAACAAGEPCRLHIALHGCLQSVSNIGEDYVRHAGYNEWADTNHIIVLYPQTQPVALTGFVVTNPEACWDWFGYLDANPEVSPTYLLKSGRQIRTIKAMIDRITSGASQTAPQRPGGPWPLVAVDQSDTAIDLAWTAIAGSAQYDVLRQAPNETTFTKIGSTAGLSYADSGLVPATQYLYRVQVAAGGVASTGVAAATLKSVPPCDEPGQCP